MSDKRNPAPESSADTPESGDNPRDIERAIRDEKDPAVIRARLNTETARIAWQELAPHFARGSVVVVDTELDLVEVAAAFVEDRQQDVSKWLERGALARAQDHHAERWNREAAEMWAVVIAPWVLVQETRKSSDAEHS